MALVQCRECDGHVSESARRCPHCGVGRPGKIELPRWRQIAAANGQSHGPPYGMVAVQS
jgi:hypothetical protein